MLESSTAYQNPVVVKDEKLDCKGSLGGYNKTLELKSDHLGVKRNKEIVFDEIGRSRDLY